jgi:hypothetical protein
LILKANPAAACPALGAFKGAISNFPPISTAVSNQSTFIQLFPTLQLPPPAFEPLRLVRMSTEYNYKYIDNISVPLLPYRMFRSPSSSISPRASLNCPRFPLLDLLSVNSASSVLKSGFDRSSVVPSRAKQANPFRIRTSAKCAHNSFRMRTSKTQHLKSFRIRTYEKKREGGLPPCANPAIAGTIRVLDPDTITGKEGARCDD